MGSGPWRGRLDAVGRDRRPYITDPAGNLADASYHGHHYNYECEQDDQALVGRPVQDRIPIWVVGVWHRPKSMRRVLRCDGVVPQYQGRDGTPDDARAMLAWLAEHGGSPDLDVVAEGETPTDNPAEAGAHVMPWAEAGCTWWLETRWDMPHHGAARMRQIRERLRVGPPRLPASNKPST